MEQAVSIFKMEFFKLGITFIKKIYHILGACNFEQVVISWNLPS